MSVGEKRFQQDFLSYDRLAALSRTAARTISLAETTGDFIRVQEESEVLDLYRAASPRASEILDYRNNRLKEIALEDRI